MPKSILSQNAKHLPKAPIARRDAVRICHHGIEVTDDYAWLRDPGYPKVESPEILEYLKAENAYFDAAMAPIKPLTEQIFKEIKDRIKEDDESVPVRNGDWDYQWRFEKGAQYRRWYRKPIDGKDWTCILDEPDLAKGHEYFRLGGMSISPDGRYLAYSTDIDGSERFTLFIRDLKTGDILTDRIPETIGAPVWAADNQTLLYRLVNENWRPYMVKAHHIGKAPESDRLVYEEEDGGFFVHIDKSQSREWIIISSASHETSEVHIIPANDPLTRPRVLSNREAGHEYDLDHASGTFFIRSNKNAPNFQIFHAPESDPAPHQWTPLLAASDRDYYRSVTAFRSALVIEQRHDGLDQIRIVSHDGKYDHFIDFPENAYRAELSTNPEPDMERIRIGYDSMITPATIYDYDLKSRQLITRKTQEIPSGYDKDSYETKRLMAPARDGAKIPISIVYKKGSLKQGPFPLHLYGYGAYGLGIPPSFSTSRLSLLDRGFAFAIAHIRGGDELGRPWYEGGKKFSRTNTFNDFIDAADYLVQSGYAEKGKISASGGSAGGKLMGAIANKRPDLWRAIIAHVPFVDVLHTMLDESLPLTPIEWPEWGNPAADTEAFRYIQAYSPYENVTSQNYPPMMVTCGLNDPRVTYWEPAKWVAKLRARKTDDNLIIFKTNMGAGHGGKSGRYDALYEVAEEYSFILMAFGEAKLDMPAQLASGQ